MKHLHSLPAYAPVAAATLIFPRAWTGRLSDDLAPRLGALLAPALPPRLLSNYGRFLLDFMHAAWRGPRGLGALVPRITGLDAARAAEAGGRGLLLVSAHLGHWELGGFALGAAGLPFLAVAANRGSPGMRRLRAWARDRFGLPTLPVREDGTEPDAFHALAGRLRAGDRAGMLVDRRDPATEGIVFSRAPLLLQRRTGCAIVPFACLLDPDGRYTLRLAEAIPPGPDSGERLESVLRGWIAENPDQHYLFPVSRLRFPVNRS